MLLNLCLLSLLQEHRDVCKPCSDIKQNGVLARPYSLFKTVLIYLESSAFSKMMIVHFCLAPVSVKKRLSTRV